MRFSHLCAGLSFQGFIIISSSPSPPQSSSSSSSSSSSPSSLSSSLSLSSPPPYATFALSACVHCSVQRAVRLRDAGGSRSRVPIPSLACSTFIFLPQSHAPTSSIQIAATLVRTMASEQRTRVVSLDRWLWLCCGVLHSHCTFGGL